ncbi:hypothetical protein [Marichromatium gracile]|uniref:Uncharacterized protein n=1 Tax=Marichromatium gracile TaxID=1048 RepID=A0A4R4AAA0_MARGR|nr:hypothetical protein [Marichromatium gracile]TCW35888.1 hypothetical protein EDC29_10562 [Marichromatium gracile]
MKKDHSNNHQENKYYNSSFFLFSDGNIPVSKTKSIPHVKLKKSFFNERISMEETPYGVVIRIDHDDGTPVDIHVRDIFEFRRDRPIMNLFFEMIKEARN